MTLSYIPKCPVLCFYNTSTCSIPIRALQVSQYLALIGKSDGASGWIPWRAGCSTEVGWSTGVCFDPLVRRNRRVCKGEVLGLRAHNTDPLGRVITMRPATVSTAVAPRHKDSPLQRHGCAFVLPLILSVPHSGGLERHHGVPIKPLGVEDSPDSLIHKYAHTHTHIRIHTSVWNLHMYCKYTNALRWQKLSIVHLTSLSAI